MKALLDTHAFLWWITDDHRLSDRVRKIIGDGGNRLFLSAASGWEMMIKMRLGRLALPKSPEKFIFEQLSENGIESLPVQMSHALHTYALPDIHRDPFDRMIVAQARMEQLPILTADNDIAGYDVEVIW